MHLTASFESRRTRKNRINVFARLLLITVSIFVSGLAALYHSRMPCSSCEFALLRLDGKSGGANHHDSLSYFLTST